MNKFREHVARTACASISPAKIKEAPYHHPTDFQGGGAPTCLGGGATTGIKTLETDSCLLPRSLNEVASSAASLGLYAPLTEYASELASEGATRERERERWVKNKTRKPERERERERDMG